jgi:hypothetical protein
VQHGVKLRGYQAPTWPLVGSTSQRLRHRLLWKQRQQRQDQQSSSSILQPQLQRLSSSGSPAAVFVTIFKSVPGSASAAYSISFSGVPAAAISTSSAPASAASGGLIRQRRSSPASTAFPDQLRRLTASASATSQSQQSAPASATFKRQRRSTWLHGHSTTVCCVLQLLHGVVLQQQHKHHATFYMGVLQRGSACGVLQCLHEAAFQQQCKHHAALCMGVLHAAFYNGVPRAAFCNVCAERRSSSSVNSLRRPTCGISICAFSRPSLCLFFSPLHACVQNGG